MSKNIDLKKLKNPEGRSFLDELQNAENSLSRQDAKPFFRAILPHFEYEISPKIGNEILKTIRNVIENQKIAEIFTANDFTLSLPFSQKQYVSSVLDIFLALVESGVSVFSRDVCSAFSQLISRSPDKSLTILANFAQHSKDSDDDPLPVFDLLIKNAELYANDDNLVYSYLSFLAYLCDNFPDFKQKRLSKCSKILSLVMDTDEIDILKSCYIALKTYRQLAPPLSSIKRHLRSKSLQSTLISYLVLSPPIEVDAKLLDMLLTIASSDVRGSYILFQAAQKEENADLLIENEEWVRMALPTHEDTLKLLLVVFQHHELRNPVSQNPYFLKLLMSTFRKTKDTGVITVICTMMRRITIDKAMVQNLKELDFLTAFFNKALEIGENMAIHSALLLTDTFARIGFFPGFLDLIEQVTDIAKEGGPLSNVAAQLAVDLAVYPKCMKIICRCGMESFFKKKMKDQKLRKPAQKFFELLEDGE